MKHERTGDPQYHSFETRFGWMRVFWSIHLGEPKILRIVLPRPGGQSLQRRARVYPAPMQRDGFVSRLGINPGPTNGLLEKTVFGLELANHDEGSCETIDRLSDRISAFLAGEDIRFSLGIVRMDLCPPFQRKVLTAEHAIARGKVSTYARIARHLGSPKAARAVGNALAKNPFPIIIPCHRAVRRDLSLGGYQGGLGMKRALLEMEGVEFDEAGRVVSPNLFY